MNKLISIIIPTYNRAHLIEETIKSVFAQTYTNWEIIVVDDGSTDDTIKVLNQFKSSGKIKILNRPSHRPKGGNAARNFGFELSGGNYIKWLDSDDILTSDCLEKQLSIIETDKTDVVFGRSKWFRKNPKTGELIHGELWHEGIAKGPTLLKDFIMGRARFSNNDGLWRRAIIGQKPYNENLKNSQEFLMIIKMLSRNIKVSLIEDILVLIRSHKDQMADKRKYSVYAKNQILARYLALQILKEEDLRNPSINKYLVKSNLHYLLSQIKNKDLDSFLYNLKNCIKTLIAI